jgi:hypothetical protein
MINKRIDELSSLGDSAIYTDQNPSEEYDPQNGIFLLSIRNGNALLRYFGGWMPDANTSKPFPSGFVCDDEIKLKKTDSGYAPDAGADVKISDDKITAQISCSPRNGLSGDFLRARY